MNRTQSIVSSILLLLAIAALALSFQGCCYKCVTLKSTPLEPQEFPPMRDRGRHSYDMGLSQ